MDDNPRSEGECSSSPSLPPLGFVEQLLGVTRINPELYYTPDLSTEPDRSKYEDMMQLAKVVSDNGIYHPTLYVSEGSVAEGVLQRVIEDAKKRADKVAMFEFEDYAPVRGPMIPAFGRPNMGGEGSTYPRRGAAKEVSITEGYASSPPEAVMAEATSIGSLIMLFRFLGISQITSSAMNASIQGILKGVSPKGISRSFWSIMRCEGLDREDKKLWLSFAIRDLIKLLPKTGSLLNALAQDGLPDYVEYHYILNCPGCGKRSLPNLKAERDYMILVSPDDKNLIMTVDRYFLDCLEAPTFACKVDESHQNTSVHRLLTRPMPTRLFFDCTGANFDWTERIFPIYRNLAQIYDRLEYQWVASLFVTPSGSWGMLHIDHTSADLYMCYLPEEYGTDVVSIDHTSADWSWIIMVYEQAAPSHLLTESEWLARNRTDC